MEKLKRFIFDFVAGRFTSGYEDNSDQIYNGDFNAISKLEALEDWSKEETYAEIKDFSAAIERTFVRKPQVDSVNTWIKCFNAMAENVQTFLPDLSEQEKFDKIHQLTVEFLSLNKGRDFENDLAFELICESWFLDGIGE